MDPRQRAWVAAITALVLTGCALGALAPASSALAAVLAVSMQLGVGVAPWLLVRPLPGHLFSLLSIVGGQATCTLVGLPLAWFGAWHPRGAGYALLAIALACCVGALVRERRAATLAPAPAARPAGSPGWLSTAWPTALAVVGALVAWLGAAAVAGDPRPAGIAVTAGWPWAVGFVAVIVALLVLLLRGGDLMVPVLLLTSTVVVSQALAYENPTVMVAGRHLGIVDWITERGALDTSNDIYQAWSGLFAGTALVLDWARFARPFAYAAWWGALAAPVMVLAVRAVAGRFVNPRRAWLAGLVFGLGSSLTTSFYAPQVAGFAYAMTILALMVAWPRDDGLAWRATTVGVLSVALATTHQLTPYMLCSALLALVVLGLVRPVWMLALVAVPAVAWAGINFRVMSRYVSPKALGRLFANLAPPEHPVPQAGVDPLNRLTFYAPAAALLVIGLVALVVMARAHTRTSWALAIAAGSPLVVMLGTEYGQEGIFRVALFALPWLAILAVLPVRAGTEPSPRRRRLERAVACLSVVVLAAVHVVGTTGMDWARVIRRNDVTAMGRFERSAPPETALVCLGSCLNTPGAFTADYPRIRYYSREDIAAQKALSYPQVSGAAYDPRADLAGLTARIDALGGRDHFIVLSDGMAAYQERYGLQRTDDFARLWAAVDASPDWRVVVREPGIAVYARTGQPS